MLEMAMVFWVIASWASLLAGPGVASALLKVGAVFLLLFIVVGFVGLALQGSLERRILHHA